MYRLTVEVQPLGQVLPTQSVIEFDLPSGATDADAITVARGIRRSFREVYDVKVKIVAFQKTGLTADIDLGSG